MRVVTSIKQTEVQAYHNIHVHASYCVMRACVHVHMKDFKLQCGIYNSGLKLINHLISFICICISSNPSCKGLTTCN